MAPKNRTAQTLSRKRMKVAQQGKQLPTPRGIQQATRFRKMTRISHFAASTKKASQKVQRTQHQSITAKKEAETAEVTRKNQNIVENQRKAVEKEVVEEEESSDEPRDSDDNGDSESDTAAYYREEQELEEQEEEYERRLNEDYPIEQEQYKKCVIKEMKQEGWGYFEFDGPAGSGDQFDQDQFDTELERRIMKFRNQWR